MTSAALALYNSVLLLGAPVLLLKKAIKFGRRGHRHEWDLSRWNAPTSLPKNATRVVFVALSWGEIAVLDLLSRRLNAAFPNLEIVWSIRDKSAQQMAQTQFSYRTIVPMPFDFALPVQNWLDAVRPDVLIVVEKFWWPNLVWGARARGAQVVLVNGRSRGRDKMRYRLISGFQRWVLSAFDGLLFESESQIERVREVLPRGARVEATGNVKFAFNAPQAPREAQSLEKWLRSAQKPLLFAGSTSPIDETWALDAWQRVRQEFSCALVIAPRRIERAAQIAAQIEARGLKVSRRTAPRENADVWLLDSLGELSFAYQFGVAAYVGGSVEGRGHNLIEPLAWGVPVAYGPIRGDFEAAQRAAEEAQVGFRLHSPQDLADFWKKALGNAQWRAGVAKNAKILLEK
ncbi:MAG TPA: glycosyltransferase N-terminal domain-containing protein, partial [Abditibacterium sp.]